MDRVKAQDIASKLIGLGFTVSVKRTIVNAIENYSIHVSSGGLSANVIANFAQTNSVVATINDIVLS